MENNETLVAEILFALNLEGDYLTDETANLVIPEEYCK